MIYDMKARRLEQSTLHALRAQQRDGSGTERLGELPLPEETPTKQRDPFFGQLEGAFWAVFYIAMLTATLTTCAELWRNWQR